MSPSPTSRAVASASERSSDRAPLHVRPARPGDAARTAAIHRRALPSGFFARLGTRFLARYHATFAASERARLLVAERGGAVVGFLAGTIDNEAHYRTVLRRRWPGLVVAGVGAMLRRPRLAAEFLRTRVGRYGRAVRRRVGRSAGAVGGMPGSGSGPSGGTSHRAATAPAPASSPGGTETSDGARTNRPVAVLTHVAVSEDAQGTGAGRALVEAFTAEVRRARVGEVRLVTDRGGPGARFYRRLGWRSRGVRRGSDGSLVEEFVRRP